MKKGPTPSLRKGRARTAQGEERDEAGSVHYRPKQVLFALHAVLQRIGSGAGVQGRLDGGDLFCDVFQVPVPGEEGILRPPRGLLLSVRGIQCEAGTVFAALELLGTGYFCRVQDHALVGRDDPDRTGSFSLLGNGRRLLLPQQAVQGDVQRFGQEQKLVDLGIAFSRFP